MCFLSKGDIVERRGRAFFVKPRITRVRKDLVDAATRHDIAGQQQNHVLPRDGSGLFRRWVRDIGRLDGHAV
jgi:hypothetical protein